MKYEVELGGRFVVDVNFWSGKARLSYENAELEEGDERNTFALGEEKVSVAGTLFSGVYLVRGEEKALIVKLRLIDYLAGIIPFIVSLLGGPIGAVFGAAGFFLCYKLMPYIKHYVLRLLMCIGFAIVIFGIILLLATLFPALFGLKGSAA